MFEKCEFSPANWTHFCILKVTHCHSQEFLNTQKRHYQSSLPADLVGTWHICTAICWQVVVCCCVLLGLAEVKGDDRWMPSSSAEEAQGDVWKVSAVVSPLHGQIGKDGTQRSPPQWTSSFRSSVLLSLRNMCNIWNVFRCCDVIAFAGRRKNCRKSWTGSDKTASAKPRPATKTRRKRNGLVWNSRRLLDILAVSHLCLLILLFNMYFPRYLFPRRELNEINRKHIQDSVSLIRGVSAQAHACLSPATLQHTK